MAEPMEDLAADVDRLAADGGFSGVVRVDRGEETILAKAYGEADRAHGIPNRLDTIFGIASGTKGLTALSVVALIEDGLLDWHTPAREILGSDLPLIDDAVTVEHLVGHRSGIGDYLDEEVERPVTDYVMPVPVHELDATEAYVRILDGHPRKFRPDEAFSYCNSGYVVLALIAERVGGARFADVVHARVCEPAGMVDTAFLRSDELPGRVALGYLDVDGLRTNVFHLPVLGSGDGGIFTTVSDVLALWRAAFAGRIVSEAGFARMTTPRTPNAQGSLSYGLGFWLPPEGSAVILEGYDAGAAFRSVHDPASGVTHTVVSNCSDVPWDIARYLKDRFGG